MNNHVNIIAEMFGNTAELFEIDSNINLAINLFFGIVFTDSESNLIYNKELVLIGGF